MVKVLWFIVDQQGQLILKLDCDTLPQHIDLAFTGSI